MPEQASPLSYGAHFRVLEKYFGYLVIGFWRFVRPTRIQVNEALALTGTGAIRGSCIEGGRYGPGRFPRPQGLFQGGWELPGPFGPRELRGNEPKPAVVFGAQGLDPFVLVFRRSTAFSKTRGVAYRLHHEGMGNLECRTPLGAAVGAQVAFEPKEKEKEKRTQGCGS